MAAWQGSVEFGDGWAIFDGRASENALHAHACLQIAWSPSGRIRAASGGGRTYCGPAFLIAPLFPHRLEDGGGPIKLAFFDPASKLARGLQSAMSGPMTIAPPAVRRAMRRRGRETIASLACAFEEKGADLSPRLAAALAAVGVESRAPARAAAAAGGVSPSRLRALTRASIGVSLCRLLLWRKLASAGRAAACGAGLAEAASAGGFADQSHMTRVMKAMFGITPGAIVPAIAAGSARPTRHID